MNSILHRNREEELQILFEDQWFVAVNKLPGLSVQDDKTKGRSLHHLLSIHYRAQGDSLRLWPIHRIDKRASGVIIFAKSKSATARLSAMFQEGAVRKCYWAVTAKEPSPEQGRWEDFIKKNGRVNKSFLYSDAEKGAKPAAAEYRLISRSDRYFMLEVVLLTGRHHQIRAQMSGRGMPIKGDIKYGSKRTNKDGSIHLHARSLSFVHPFNNEKICIEAAPINEVVWQVLSEGQ